jgi:hypothetical protein
VVELHADVEQFIQEGIDALKTKEYSTVNFFVAEIVDGVVRYGDGL